MTSSSLAAERTAKLSPEKVKLLEILLQRRAERSFKSRPTRRTANMTRVPTSSSQRRLWFIDQLEGNSRPYNLPVAMRLRGRLDDEALQAALNELVVRHESLRTTFVEVKGEPMQQIASDATLQLSRADLIEAADSAAQLQQYYSEALHANFDLQRGPLIRGQLIKLAADDHVLLIIVHHIVFDGWSAAVLVRDLAALYEQLIGARQQKLAPPSLQYADYVVWQLERTRDLDLGSSLPYWLNHLRGAPALLELPLDRSRPTVQSYRGSSWRFKFDRRLSDELRAFARHHELTVAMVLYAAWVLLLSRLSGQQDVVVGMPVANRKAAELESVIGLFVNTVAARTHLESGATVAELMSNVKQHLVQSYAHESCPFEKLVEALQPARTLSYSPIFQVMFAMQTVRPGVVCANGLRLEHETVPLITSQFDLTLSVEDDGAEFTGQLTYASDLFNAQTIQRWAESFILLLRGMLDFPERSIDQLALLSPQDVSLLDRFNATTQPFSNDALIHELIEEQVRRTPTAVALICDETHVTYAELNAKANQLARYLRSVGVRAGQKIGLCVERSTEMVVGLLGILKSGAAYVPLDPDYPAERLANMLEDAAPQVLLIHARLRAGLPRHEAPMIALDEQWSAIAAYDTENLSRAELGAHPKQLAYVIFTSGSTGRPKGAMNAHVAVVNRLQWMQRAYQLVPEDCVLQKTPFSFDVSVWEFFWPLLIGARLTMARPGGHRDPHYLKELIDAQRVTRLHFVPSMLQVFLDTYQPGECPSLRHVICSGEELPLALQNRLLAGLPQARLSNLYGPTEAAVDVTSWECEPREDLSRVPIGRPIANLQMYVLDRFLQRVPIGVTGEIFIGGVGVGEGYLQRPQLTAERFIADPFSAQPNARLYKTGDVGRWRTDGAIEYLGRNDHQVKIRGLRIELGEIEERLRANEAVKEVVVVAREDVPGEKRLVAYIVGAPHAETALSVDSLRSYLGKSMPEYMVPSAFVLLDEFPLSPNGKLDRRALPAPTGAGFSARAYEEPESEPEQMLAKLWQELLRMERVGRGDNFFELGGHSLLIVCLKDRLASLGWSTELRRVFESKTLADLASTLRRRDHQQTDVPVNGIPLGCTEITPPMLTLVALDPSQIQSVVNSVPGGSANVRDIYPLAPLQEGILFHHLLSARGDTYVVATLLKASSRAQVDRLISALQTVIDRHDALRTAIVWGDELPQPVQVVYREASLPVGEFEFSSSNGSIDELREYLAPERQTLDIRRAPLMRLQVVRERRADQWYALLQMHHIIGDNTSQDVILEEIVALMAGRELPMRDLSSYRAHIASVLAQGKRDDGEKYFREKLGDIEEPTTALGLTDVHGAYSAVADAEDRIEHALVQRMRAQARQWNVSTAALLHAAWGLVVGHTSGKTQVATGTVLLGRMNGAQASSRGVGIFINTLPLRLNLEGVVASQLVEATQRELGQLLDYEHASLSLAQRCSGINAKQALFNTLFNYRRAARSEALGWESITGLKVVAKYERTNYPIALSVNDTDDAVWVHAQTDQRVDPKRLIGYLREAIASLIAALEQAPNTPALALKISPADERRHLLELSSAPAIALPAQRSIHHLFERRAAEQPGAVAAVLNDRVLTFDELNREANQLARYLQARGVRSGGLVGICMDRSVEMLIAILGVLKAGGAYVPLDPTYPLERLLFMLEDSSPELLLTLEAVRERLPQVATDVVALDEGWNDLVQAFCDENLPSDASSSQSDHLAYVIYTSGSTGTPKGVMVEHADVVNLWRGLEDLYEMSEPVYRVALNASINFDASIQQLVQWLSGRTIYIVPQQARQDAALMLKFLQDNAVEAIDCTPSQLRSWIAQGLLQQPTQLRVVLVGGEAIEPDLWRSLARAKNIRFFNVYGPTECTVDATVASVSDEQRQPHIGRPMFNRSLYILNSIGQLVPVGVPGEIFIGGLGVGRGYLQRPALTATRFVPDPYAKAPALMYRTGDVGCWLEDGTIRYFGRNDGQVKLRGFRIELGEIEAQLRSIPTVHQAAVVVREDVAGDQRLVAYVEVRDADEATRLSTAKSLRDHLKTVLPSHMVPSAIICLNTLPLTPNGKLNRRQLPAPALEAYATAPHEPARDAVECALAEIWCELLRIDKVSRGDNFFDLGGHSLLVLKLIGSVNHRFNTTLKVADIYRCPVLCELAARVQGGDAQDAFVDLETESFLDPSIVPLPGKVRAIARAILLTGATGFVGRFLLTELLERTSAQIYCVIRAKTTGQAVSRLRKTLAKWNLWREEFASRLVAVPGDLRLPNLGLQPAAYQMLSRGVDSIYHCATSMNHLETYAMAKPANVEGTRELLELAVTDTPKVLNYVSTLSIFSGVGINDSRWVSESTSIDAERHFSSRGYAASKWVSEKLLLKACERGIACNIFRVGLVWADPQGRFDELQNAHRMLKTALILGCGIANFKFDLPPTPVDYVARAIVALGQKRVEGGGIFHVSSAIQRVDDLFACVRDVLAQPFELVSHHEWIMKVKHRFAAGEVLPAAPLVEYAFSMDAQAFAEQQRSREFASTRIDCALTHSALEGEGIITPQFDAALVAACTRRLLAESAETSDNVEAQIPRSLA